MVTLSERGRVCHRNPAAKTRLVECELYLPALRAFCGRRHRPTKKAGWVSKGLIAVEIRNLVQDRYDFTAALLARCGGAGEKFPSNHEALFAAQSDPWIAKAQA